MDAGEVAVVEHDVGDGGRVAGHEVDDARRAGPPPRSSCMMYQALGIAAEAGFQTTVLPMSAGAVGRLPAIEVKLKGVTA